MDLRGMWGLVEGTGGSGCLMPHIRFANDNVKAARYLDKAAQMRRHAYAAQTARLRVTLLENAELYDRLAEQAERKSPRA